VSVSQSILEILKTITIVIVFKISKMDCDTELADLCAVCRTTALNSECRIGIMLRAQAALC
jgi:hypothetical protein